MPAQNRPLRFRSLSRLAPVATLTLALFAAGCGVSPFAHGSQGADGADQPNVARTYTPPASIDRTGRADVTAALQSFLKMIPDHSIISFTKGAKYRIEGTLDLRARNDMVVNGNGATFFATTPGDRTRSQWRLENMSNLIFENMVIIGANPHGGQYDDAYQPAYEAQHGVDVHGGERIEIRDLNIADVYGDFIYVGGNNAPLFGGPDNVWIHDVYGRRNGRQGISVTAGSRITIENNDLADMRRATFDFEADAASGSVQGVTVRNNTIGNGRLLFVSAHGGGDMSNFLIANNRLHNESIGIDMVSPAGIRRHNVVVTGNTSDLLAGNPRGAIIRFVDYDNVTVTNNTEPGAWHRNMYMVGFQNTCNYTASGNNLGQYGAGDYVILANNYVCKPMAAGSEVYQPPSWFAGTELGIDPGGPSTKGVVGCTDKAHCADYLLNSPRFVSAPALTNSTDPRMLTMLEGEQHYQIPMRPGTYIVTVSWAEPRTDGSEHVFHLEIERQRVILHGENLVKAPRTLVTRSFRVTTADGALNLDFLVNPVVSYIDIRRA